MTSEGTFSHDFTPGAQRMAVHLLLGLVKLGQDVAEVAKEMDLKFYNQEAQQQPDQEST